MHSTYENKATGQSVPLGIYCRPSLAEFLDADAIFEVTRQGFDWFQEKFDYAYPFAKYDQLFVPEFNAGAMENAGAVTIRDQYVFRSKVTDAAYELRAETILHELAHMWFGDLVTMEWWNDLWLNESFATYTSIACQAYAPGSKWPHSWTTFANSMKTWAYRQDQLPSTHPIMAEIRDLDDVLVNFDGITYAKGASVLKQLVAYVGMEEFFSGVQAYFKEHAFGNTRLSDLLGALEKTSGRDLKAWSKAWLETAGINVLRPEITTDAARRHHLLRRQAAGPGAARRRQGGADAPPAPHRDRPLRARERQAGPQGPHRAGCRRRADRGPAAGGPRPPGCGAAQRRRPVVRQGPPGRRVPRHRHPAPGRLRRVPAARPVLGLRLGHDPRRRAGHPRLPGPGALRHRQGVRHRRGAVAAPPGQARPRPLRRPPTWRETGLAKWTEAALEGLHSAVPGSDHQLAWARAFAATARTDAQLDLLAALLDGTKIIEGLAVDTELRWDLLGRLAATGRADEKAIAAELERDKTSAGEQHAAWARAARPTAEAKAKAWASVVESDKLPNAVQESVIGGFQQSDQRELLAAYSEKYFAMVKDVWDRRSHEMAQQIAVGLYPPCWSPRRPWTPRTPGWPPPSRARRCADWSRSAARASSAPSRRRPRTRPPRPDAAA
ncbi:hypothetical protein GCM10020000_54200 [Streptomyces olivoverticillatus]